MSLRRIPMELRLQPQTSPRDPPIRTARNDDKEDLAILLYAAYRGTIDDDGGTFADAASEIDALFGGTYGRFLSNCSFVIEQGEYIASASLITWWEPHNAPLVAFTMTRPESQGRGLARDLLQASMRALFNHGYDRLTLVVTDGNAPAQKLYTSLGFRPITSDNPEG